MFRNSERGKENDRNKGYLKKSTIRGTADYYHLALEKTKTTEIMKKDWMSLM